MKIIKKIIFNRKNYYFPENFFLREFSTRPGPRNSTPHSEQMRSKYQILRSNYGPIYNKVKHIKIGCALQEFFRKLVFYFDIKNIAQNQNLILIKNPNF